MEGIKPDKAIYLLRTSNRISNIVFEGNSDNAALSQKLKKEDWMAINQKSNV